MPNLLNGSKGDSNPGLFDCESGVLPRSINIRLAGQFSVGLFFKEFLYIFSIFIAH